LAKSTKPRLGNKIIDNLKLMLRIKTIGAWNVFILGYFIYKNKKKKNYKEKISLKNYKKEGLGHRPSLQPKC
jgi:hypothetical protein